MPTLGDAVPVTRRQLRRVGPALVDPFAVEALALRGTNGVADGVNIILASGIRVGIPGATLGRSRTSSGHPDRRRRRIVRGEPKLWEGDQG